MPFGRTSIDFEDDSKAGVTHFSQRHRVLVSMSDELIAAVDGWRAAHGLSEQSDALGELVRLGLMSEIAKIYRLVTEDRDAPGENDPLDDPRAQHRAWTHDRDHEDDRASRS